MDQEIQYFSKEEVLDQEATAFLREKAKQTFYKLDENDE
jgi:hypothetical protein